MSQLSNASKHKLKQPYRTASEMRKQGWLLDDLINTKNTLRVVKFLKFAVKLGYFAMFVEGAYDTYETWEHTHSWEATAKTAAKAVADIVVAALAGLAIGTALALMGITAPVWGVCLLAGFAAATIGTVLEKGWINPAIEAL